MSIKERKEREREEMRDLILTAAREIIKLEGLDSLSIRKIANRIEYSPAIIYHYFEDKDDILNHLMRKGYEKILEALASVPESTEAPEKKLKDMTRTLIYTALEMPDEYKAIQLSSVPEVLAQTSSLFEGAASKKTALGILFKCLKSIYKDMDDGFLELTAQIVWTSTFGLIIKLILEKDISEEQRNKLIEHHIRCIIDGLIVGRTFNNILIEERK